MKKEYLQPFLVASEVVSKKFFNTENQIANITRERTLEMDREVIIALGIKGQLSGIALFGLSKSEALQLSCDVLAQQGMPGYQGWDDLTQSVLLEYGNQVVGNVTELYEKDGFTCDITTPSFISKEQLQEYRRESIRFEVRNHLATMIVKLHIQKN